MGGGGGSRDQVVTEDIQPWAPQQAPLMRSYEAAGDLYGQGGPTMYGGPLVAPFAGETEAAQRMQTARAQAGSPLVPQAQAVMSESMAGMQNPYLAGLQQTAAGGATNPYLDQLYQTASRPMTEQFQNVTAPGIVSRAIETGRMGSGATASQMGSAADILGRNLAGLSARIYAPAYESERQRQFGAQRELAGLGARQGAQRMAAAQMAPALAQADYGDIGQLAAVGAQKEAKGQQQIQDALQRHQFAQERPYDALSRFQQYLGHAGGGPTGQKQEAMFGQPRAVTALGGAQIGADIGQGILRAGGENPNAWVQAAPWIASVLGGLGGWYGA